MNIYSSFVSPVRKDITLLLGTAMASGKDEPSLLPWSDDCICYNLMNSFMAEFMSHRSFCWYTHTAKAELEKIIDQKFGGIASFRSNTLILLVL